MTDYGSFPTRPRSAPPAPRHLRRRPRRRRRGSGRCSRSLHDRVESDRAQVAGRLVDDRYFCTPKRVGAILPWLETDTNDPFVSKASILARAHVPNAIVPARKNVVAERSASLLQPSPHCFPGRLEQFNLNGRWVFCCTATALSRTSPRETISPMLTLTTSQPRNLPSMAKSNSAQSRRRRCWSSQKRIAQTCCYLRARFAPADAPRSTGRRSSNAKSSGECLILHPSGRQENSIIYHR